MTVLIYVVGLEHYGVLFVSAIVAYGRTKVLHKFGLLLLGETHVFDRLSKLFFVVHVRREGSLGVDA